MEQQCLDIAHQAAHKSDHGERGSKQGKPYDCPILLPWQSF